MSKTYRISVRGRIWTNVEAESTGDALKQLIEGGGFRLRSMNIEVDDEPALLIQQEPAPVDAGE